MKKDIFFLIILGIIFSVSIPLFKTGGGQRDFLAYWSMAHLFATGGNPYNQSEMSSLQKAVSPERFTDANGLIGAWNPPWLILILIPIGILPYTIAVPGWVFCNTLLIGLSILLTWKLCVGHQRSRGLLYAFLAGFLFAETLSYLAYGQITAILLLTIVLVIWLLNRNMDMLAGIALLITTIKPQISYFFILIVLLWVIQHHRWKVIAGFLSSAFISMVFFWIIIPGWVSDYIFNISNLSYQQFYTSTIGSFIAEIFHLSIFKYSSVLLLLGIKPIMKIVNKGDWLTTTNLVLLISVPLSPFGFNFDQIVIIPALIQMIAWISKQLLSRITLLIVVLSLLFIDLVNLKMLTINKLEQYWFFWIPIAVMMVYLFSCKMKSSTDDLIYTSGLILPG